ncbi:hypothetical protein GQ43DRAFT_483846 [Delitschia confertaspora ATCC 74209]|uniref:DNA damage-binding protein 1 n=1 Tax=Delitschia confertaspora ATCC 74209 TaxID=1513339 RepID=A0A9P4JEJ0_9PLEO|nr:hypothetical protein GQ43DRAFT_483846 [Delitschia confertaspora ATCC 74209]
MTSFSTLSMYALTLQPPSDTQQAIVGEFTGVKGHQQILVANGSRLTLYEVTRLERVLKEIHTHDVFGIIRGLALFRLAGASKDCIIVTSDSGRIVTLEYLPHEKEFKTIHYETFGKSGIRRVIPGQYVAADPKGRAVMVASVEKNKIVYILNRNVNGELTISSPLEAHKPHTLVYDVCGLDVGYDNPLFATLEVDYSESDLDPSGKAYQEIEKQLVYYELDLGLNHVVRKWSEKVDKTSNRIFRVPGGSAGPSGVLCCGEENISYRFPYNSSSTVLRVPIPRRNGVAEDPLRKRYIVGGTMYTMKRGSFFFLLQSEDGDLFKVTFDLAGDSGSSKQTVLKMKIKYFDTIPLARSLCILKSGFLYVACESGDRKLYELEQLGDDTDDPVFDSDNYPADPLESYAPAYFQVRPLINLNPVRSITSMNPLMDMQIANLTDEDAPQIYSICGSGSRSTFRTSRNALGVCDLIESQLPQRASAIWTTKKTSDDEHDSYIVLSLLSHTLVLAIGEDVEEALNTGFLKETTTLGIQQFGDDNLLQIYPRGIRHINSIGEITDWHSPPHRTIVACASNNRQVAIALSSGEIYYFECDPDGMLAKAEDEANLEGTVTCLGIAEVPEGRVRSDFLAVGCDDKSVRIFSLVPDHDGEILNQLSVQALSASPSSIAIMSMRDRSSHGYSLYLHVGLSSGVYIRTAMDEVTGELSETRRRFLGTSPIKFAKVLAGGDPAILALTSRPWLGYTDPQNSSLALTPLNYISFDSAWTFESEQFKGIICVRGEDLRIFTFDDLSSKLHHESIELQYTPHKFVGHPEQALYYVIEKDFNVMDPATRKMFEKEAVEVAVEATKDKDGDSAMVVEMDGEQNGGATANPDGEANADDEIITLAARKYYGYPRMAGRWSSCIQIVDPVIEKAVVHSIELEKNRCALSVATVVFESHPEETFLAVGWARDFIPSPIYYKSAGVYLYKLQDNGRKLEFYHKTKLTAPPTAMLAFKGKLAIGVGNDLSLYDCGRRSLLRKAQAKACTPTRIVGLKTQGSRLIVSDLRESVTYVVHKDIVHPNRLIPFIDDSVPRWTTCTDMVDYETVAGGDKFGNLWMVRCPLKVSEHADEPNDGQPLLQDKDYLGGAPNRLELVMHYFVQDIPMAVQKTSLIAGGEKVLFWAGLQGTLGVMIPFQSRKDFKMFQQLEFLLRTNDKPLAGRDHLAYRSYYTPLKGVIDGDLIERFLVISRDMRESVASQLDGGWTVSAVEQKIWNMRGQYAF